MLRCPKYSSRRLPPHQRPLGKRERLRSGDSAAKSLGDMDDETLFMSSDLSLFVSCDFTLCPYAAVERKKHLPARGRIPTVSRSLSHCPSSIMSSRSLASFRKSFRPSEKKDSDIKIEKRGEVQFAPEVVSPKKEQKESENPEEEKTIPLGKSIEPEDKEVEKEKEVAVKDAEMAEEGGPQRPRRNTSIMNKFKKIGKTENKDTTIELSSPTRFITASVNGQMQSSDASISADMDPHRHRVLELVRLAMKGETVQSGATDSDPEKDDSDCSAIFFGKEGKLLGCAEDDGDVEEESEEEEDDSSGPPTGRDTSEGGYLETTSVDDFSAAYLSQGLGMSSSEEEDNASGTMGSYNVPAAYAIPPEVGAYLPPGEKDVSSLSVPEGKPVLKKNTSSKTNKASSSTPKKKKTRKKLDWSSRFQSCLIRAKKMEVESDKEKQMQATEELVHLGQDFIYAASTYGKIIISEVHLSNKHKTVRPVKIGGVAGGDKYIVHGILFKFALDASGLFGGDDAAAAKVAGQELKGLISYFSLAMPELGLPLMALVDYRGFRVIAMSLLPISSKSLIYGSNNAGLFLFFFFPSDAILGVSWY